MNEVETKVHQHDVTLARLAVLIEQNERRFDAIDQRFDATDRKIDNLESNTAARFDGLERRLDSLDRRMNWFLGLLFTGWLSIIGLILIKFQ